MKSENTLNHYFIKKEATVNSTRSQTEGARSRKQAEDEIVSQRTCTCPELVKLSLVGSISISKTVHGKQAFLHQLSAGF